MKVIYFKFIMVLNRLFFYKYKKYYIKNVSLYIICFDNFIVFFDFNVINQNFGSGGFGGDGFGGGGFGVSVLVFYLNFDFNVFNYGFGGGGFGN